MIGRLLFIWIFSSSMAFESGISGISGMIGAVGKVAPFGRRF